MNRWLLKTEPETYSFADLVRDGTTSWDGIANAVALKNLRAMTAGDEVLVYHTGKERRAVGRARVVKPAYPDPRGDDPRQVVVDLTAGAALAEPVTLAAMRDNPMLAGFDLLRLPRLSVVPVSAAHWQEILRMAGGR